MKCTIIPSDNLVVVDDVAMHGIDMTGVDPGIHAVQFEGDAGWIEYTDGPPESIDSVEQFRILLDRHSAALAEREARAADPYYGMPPEERLAAIKQAKIAEIDAAFGDVEQQPVTVGGHAYRGGFQSGLALDAQRRMMVEYAAANPHAAIVTVDFFDVTGTRVTLPLASDTEIDALDVCLAVGQAAAANSFKCAQLIAAAQQAVSIADVEAIKW